MIALALAAAMLPAAQPTVAPPVPADMIHRDRRMTPSGQRNAYLVLEDYARCVVRSHRENAVFWLYAWDVGDEATRSAARLERYDSSTCLRADRMAAGGELVRGAIAEALFELDFGSRWTGDAQPAVPLPAIGDPNSRLRPFARCIVARQADLARAVLATRAGSSEERRAVDRLAPGWGECVPAQRLAFRDVSLRWAVAVELYYRARATAGLGAPFAERPQ